MVPPTFTAAEATGGGGDQLDQVVVGRGHRWAPDLCAVAEGEPDPVGAGDVDVTDGGIIEQGLQTGQSVQPVEHRGCDRILGGLVEWLSDRKSTRLNSSP